MTKQIDLIKESQSKKKDANSIESLYEKSQNLLIKANSLK